MRLREITEKKTHISPSGVETDMDPRDDDYEINYGKHGTVAKHRKELGVDVKTGTRKIKEDGESTAVMAFGRMNPPTIGHQKLVDKINSLPGDPYLFLSQSQKPKTDPLDFQTKLRFTKFFFPGIAIGSPEVKTIIQALDKIHELGYKNLIYVAGSDRVDDFETLINKYNGGEGYDFDSIQVVSAGERDPDAKGAEGMSASKMRELARSEDFEQFAQGVPDQKLADELYTAVRKGMGLTQGDLEMSDSREFKDYIEHIESIVGDRLDEMQEAPESVEDQVAQVIQGIEQGLGEIDVAIDPTKFEMLMQAAKKGKFNQVAEYIADFLNVEEGAERDAEVASLEALKEIKAIMQQNESTFEDEDFDDEEDGEEPEGEAFKGMPMYDQLGKLLDSQDSPKPINSVTTDDGHEHEVSADQARALRLLATTEKVKPEVKRAFLRDIQDSRGLVDFLDQTDYHEMAHLFVKRYLH